MALEAFKAGAYDFRIEPSPKSWATQYQGGNFARNYIIKQDESNPGGAEYPLAGVQPAKPLFADRRVREAIGGFRL